MLKMLAVVDRGVGKCRVRCSAETVIDHQLVDHLTHAFFGGRHFGVAFLGQHNRLDAEDLGRRAGQAAAVKVGADLVQVPLLDQQARLPATPPYAAALRPPAPASDASGTALFTSAAISAGTRARL